MMRVKKTKPIKRKKKKRNKTRKNLKKIKKRRKKTNIYKVDLQTQLDYLHNVFKMLKNGKKLKKLITQNKDKIMI